MRIVFRAVLILFISISLHLEKGCYYFMYTPYLALLSLGEMLPTRPHATPENANNFVLACKQSSTEKTDRCATFPKQYRCARSPHTIRS